MDRPDLHEAAIVDGASKLRRIWHIDLPGIMPTIITMLTLRMGQVLNVNFEKVLLMQNPINITSSSIISTFVYQMVILQPRLDYGMKTVTLKTNATQTSYDGCILVIYIDVR